MCISIDEYISHVDKGFVNYCYARIGTACNKLRVAHNFKSLGYYIIYIHIRTHTHTHTPAHIRPHTQAYDT